MSEDDLVTTGRERLLSWKEGDLCTPRWRDLGLLLFCSVPDDLTLNDDVLLTVAWPDLLGSEFARNQSDRAFA